MLKERKVGYLDVILIFHKLRRDANLVSAIQAFSFSRRLTSRKLLFAHCMGMIYCLWSFAISFDILTVVLYVE